MTATAVAQWLRNHLVTLTKGDIARINSIITDICKLIFKMWLEIQKLDEFKHVFFIPCDSHGLQLLIGDLLKIPGFKEVLNKAQTVVKSFHHSLLQYAHLWDFQLQYNKQHQSLILSVITCWGTQYHLLQSVLDSKDALRCT